MISASGRDGVRIAFQSLAFFLASLSFAAGAADFPTKPIRVIVGYAPGGTTDQVARATAEVMAKELGQPVVIDNRAGANAIIASTIAAQAPADGYTVLFTTDTNLILNPLLYKKPPYQPERDFTPIGILVDVPQAIVVNAATSIKTLADLIAEAKKSPGRLNFGSAGLGGNSHLAGELFMQQFGVTLTHVPFKGGGPALIALLGGEVQTLFGVVSTFVPHVKSGKLRALAVTTRRRVTAVWPDVATVEELGGKGFEASIRYGMVVPKATPPATVQTLNRALNKALELPSFRKPLEADGFVVYAPEKPAYYATIIERDRKAYGALIKAKQISLE